MEIPRIIHQIWFWNGKEPRQDIPAHFQRWSTRWQALNPEWKYMSWTEESVVELLKSKYPEHLQRWQCCPRWIIRHDLARAFILHAYGGLYLDHDILPINPLHHLLDRLPSSCKLSFLEFRSLFAPPYDDELNNSFLLSSKAHPFWVALWDEGLRRASVPPSELPAKLFQEQALMMSAFLNAHKVPLWSPERMQESMLVLWTSGPWLYKDTFRAVPDLLIQYATPSKEVPLFFDHAPVPRAASHEQYEAEVLRLAAEAPTKAVCCHRFEGTWADSI